MGLPGTVAAQADDPDDDQNDLGDTIEDLETTDEDLEERHNMTETTDQLDTSDDERTLEDAIDRLESDGRHACSSPNCSLVGVTVVIASQPTVGTGW